MSDEVSSMLTFNVQIRLETRRDLNIHNFIKIICDLRGEVKHVNQNQTKSDQQNYPGGDHVLTQNIVSVGDVANQLAFLDFRK